MLISALKGSNSRLFRKVMTFRFYSWPDCLSLYMICNSLHIKFGQINLKMGMLGDNLMNIGRLLSLNNLSKYALTISICLRINLRRYTMVTNIRSDSRLTIGENISLKSIPCNCKKSCAISRVLYQAILPSWGYLTLKPHFNLTVF